MSDISQPGQTTPSIRLRAPRNLYWVRDANFTLLIDEEKGVTKQLEGDAAALWGWLCMGVSLSQCARLLGAMNNIAPIEAASEINQHLRAWQEAGLLEDGGSAP
ncbi:MAG: hypothetical protein DPW18_12990 [Chloroflexi bacterium]|nr:hypothetical protein [Chloroflexota bacterium]MDL1940977.1 hypothetical protein [Chloroflexi bacterium CFX2]